MTQRKKIGVIISQLDDLFYNRSLCFLERELFRMDMDVLAFTTLSASGIHEEFAEGECSIYTMMNFDELDGIIIFPQSLNLLQQQKILQQIHDEYRGPVVSVEIPLWDFPYIPFSDKEGMEKMIEHLTVVHGVKRIEYVTDKNRENPYYAKLAKYFTDAVKNHGLNFGVNSIHYGDGWIYSGDELVSEMIHQPDGLPEAVICCNTESAAALISALETHGVFVPQDIIVVAYGLPRSIASDEVVLTAIDRNPQTMIIAAAKKIESLISERTQAKKIESLTAGMTEEVVTPGEYCYLIEGCSCGCKKDSLGRFSRHMMRDVESVGSSFWSDYNFMTEDITECEDYKECLWKADWYTHYLGDYESFYLCLNENALISEDRMNGFSDRIHLALVHEKVGDVDITRMFEKKQMLPALYEECDHPRALIFAALHFVSHVMGYVALSYGNHCCTPERCMSKWMRSIANALEMRRGHNLLDEMLRERKSKDSTTGLYNYRGYLQCLKGLFFAGKEKRKALGIWSFDIDRFTDINEQHGREEGDRILCSVANVLEGFTGPDVVCARIGKDEFIIGGFSDRVEDNDKLIHGILQKLEELNQNQAYKIRFHHAGVCEWITNPEQISGVINNCNYKRLHIKQSLRDHAEKNESANTEEQKQVMRLIDENAFTYQYQPIVSARDGRIVAYEALMRSGSEVKIPPLTILDCARKAGRLYEIEYRTFFNLLQVVKENEAVFLAKKLFINSIPVATLLDSDYDRMCEQYGELFGKIVVEFTEQTEATGDQLATIRNRRNQDGFETAVDDYGSGYSNVSNLLTYMPNYVKIDRSLIADIPKDTNKQYFVSNIVRFAHENGFMALAEGVETSAELYTVIHLGVDLVQGYYTCRPQDTMLESIDNGRVIEILDINSRLRIGRVKKTYHAEAGETVDIINLYDKEYTDVQISGEGVTITGNPERYIDMTVRVQDDFEGTLILSCVGLEGYANRSCVEVGNNCRVNLVIDGKVRLLNKGIRIPESSSITLVGDGDLMIRVKSNDAYAIGGASTQNFGGIAIRMRGYLDIQATGKESVGIGGGYASNAICIEDTHISIQMDCVTTVAVGAFYTKIPVTVRNTRLDLVMNANSGVGIGSYNGDAKLSLTGLQMTYRCGGDSLVIIGALDGTQTNVNMNDSCIKGYLCAKECYGIACRSGEINIQMMNSQIDFNMEGMNALDFGSRRNLGKGHFESCVFSMKTNSSDGRQFGYEQEKISFLFCEGLDDEE